MNKEYWNQGGVRIKKTPPKPLLLEMFDYNPFSGMLVKKSTGKNAAYWKNRGQKSHYVVQMRLDGQLSGFRQSRLIYAWHFHDPGCFQVDHIDGNRRNERISNLRLATNSENNMNKPTKGYYYCPQKLKWRVDIISRGERVYGGEFLDEASAALQAARLKKQHQGEFANLLAITELPRQRKQMFFDFAATG